MDQRLCVIVGAAPNLGVAIARRFGSERFRVALISRRSALLPGYLATLREEGIDATGYIAHPGDFAELRAAFGRVHEELGDADVLVYNAAIARPVQPSELDPETVVSELAVNVVGALLISAAQGSLSWETFRQSLMGGVRLYCMIALILAGAAFLTLAMGYIGLPRHLAEWIGGLGLAPWQLLLALVGFYILLGCFLDGISMVVLTMGVILPTVQAAGIDLLWFGIFIVIVVELAQITPPVGFNLFVLQGMTGRDIAWIARATLPFFVLMLAALALIYAVPELATWLPAQMRR